MNHKRAGRILRSSRLSARVLTEYQVRRLLASPVFADLGHCVRLATPGTIAIDVGASVGNYALALGKAVGPHGRVLALEANPVVFRELVNSTWATSVRPHNVAASSKSGQAQLLIPTDAHGAAEPLATLEPRDDDGVSVTVACITLDELLDEAGRVSIIKIDVEGHERSVLQGATNILERDQPALVIELEQRHQTPPGSVAGTVAFLCDQGYQCHAIHGNELIPWDSYDLVKWQSDWLAADELWRKRHKLAYVNNFLFTHDS